MLLFIDKSRNGAGNFIERFPLLKTKLNIPHPRSGAVQRPRLASLLELGFKRKLTLLSAPAGFGKTTLLSDWLHIGDIPAAWVSLDAGDNDFAHFLAYLIGALQMVDAAIGKAALSELQSPQPPLAALMTPLVNDICAIPQDIACVLDDYHLISDEKIHGVLEFLLVHMPATLHIFVATRSDPPLDLARMRSNNQLVELRAVDMSFTAEESESFLNRTMGLGLSKDNVLKLEKRTEGWIAGLQLAALSMHGTSDATGAIEAFAGDDSYIADYLMQETLSRQPQAIQSFLLKTSILERMNGPLCNSVTGRSDSEGMLQELARANLFLVALDSKRCWYRYHRLFAELLRKRLPGLEKVPELHRRASKWFERNGLIHEAIEHGTKAQNIKLVAGLIEGAARTVLMKQGETATVLHWLEAVPEKEIRRNPRLSLAYAWALFYELNTDAVEPHLQNAELALQAPADNDLLAEVDAIRATAAILRGSARQSVEIFEQALERLSDQSIDMHGLVRMGLGYAYMVRGDIKTASTNLTEAARLNEASGNISVALKALCFLAFVRQTQGRLHQASETLQRALRLAAKWELENAPVMHLAHGGLAVLARERNDLAAAADNASRTVELCERSGDSMRLWVGYMLLSITQRAQGLYKAAGGSLQQAQEIIPSAQLSLARTRTATCRVRFLLEQFQIAGLQCYRQEIEEWVLAFDMGSAWLETAGAIVMPGQACELEHLTKARCLVALGRAREALDLLPGLLAVSKKAGRTSSVLENLIIQVLALEQQSRTAEASDVLRQALELGAPEGFVRIFIDAGPTMAGLLEAISSEMQTGMRNAPTGFSRGYVRKLCLACSVQGRIKEQEGLIDPLSAREMEVLQLLSAGISNREIAEQLFISLNTVKTHVKHINNKLGARVRGQAVERARELGLL